MNIMIDYLKQLQKNNNREWFHEHKELRSSATAAFENLLWELMVEIGKQDDSILKYEPKELTFKQVRDTRFSKDKSPYLPAFRAHMSSMGKLPIPVGYYLMISPDNQSFLGGGLFTDMFTDATALIRKHISEHGEEFANIINDPSFTSRFKLDGVSLKRVPKGFDPDHPMADYLKMKSWYLEYPIDDMEFEDEAVFVKKAAEIYTAMIPFHAFLNEALKDFTFPKR